MPSIQQPVTPFVTEVVEPTTEPTTVVDVLLGSFAVIGAVALVAFVLGLLCAGVLIGLKRARGQDELSGRGSDSVRLDLGGSGRSGQA